MTIRDPDGVTIREVLRPSGRCDNHWGGVATIGEVWQPSGRCDHQGGVTIREVWRPAGRRATIGEV